MTERWFIQVAALIAYLITFYLWLRAWREFRYLREPLLFLGMMIAMRLALLFWLVGRVVVFGGEPPANPLVTWYANVILLASGMALCLALVSCARIVKDA